MMRIPNIRELEDLLLKVPPLIDSYAAGENTFTERTVGWLLDMEAALQRNRLALAAELASMRGAIVTAEREKAFPQGVGPGRRARRRRTDGVAEQMLRSAVELVSRRINRDTALIAKAEESTFEVAIVGRQLKLIALDATGPVPSSKVQAIWETLCAHQVTAKYTIYIETLVGRGDALILLEQVLGKR